MKAAAVSLDGTKKKETHSFGEKLFLKEITLKIK